MCWRRGKEEQVIESTAAYLINGISMADIREALQGITEPDRSIGLLLIAFYESMKALEGDAHREGKQATTIVMAINDIKMAVGNKGVV